MMDPVHKIMVRTPSRHAYIWARDPEDIEDLKAKFQWRYGYWPDSLEVVEITDTIGGSTERP